MGRGLRRPLEHLARRDRARADLRRRRVSPAVDFRGNRGTGTARRRRGSWGSCSAGCCGTWRDRSPATGCSTRRACASSSTSATSTSARVDEFKDGGLHPGYAFPLWHGFVALVSWVSGVDPAEVMRHEPSLLAPLACALAWQAGVAVFGSRAAGAAVLFATLASFSFGAGHGGAFAQLSQPATAARQLFVPAAIALFFAAPSWRAWTALAAIFGALALVHPTYAIFVLIPLGAYAVLRPPQLARLVAVVRGRRRTGRPRAPVAAPDRRRDPVARSVSGGARACDRPVRRPARGDERPPLPARARGLRAQRRRRGRGAVSAAADRPRLAPALGALRARRRGGDAAPARGAVAVRTFLRRRLPLAVASRGRLRAAAVRPRRRPLPARPLARRAPGGARLRDRPAAALAGRLRLRAAERRPRAGDVDRARRRRLSRCSRC